MRLTATILMLAAGPLLAQYPVDVRGWINRGVTEYKSGRYQEAVAAFQRAVESDPSSVTAHLYLGTAWMQQFIPGAVSPDNQAAMESATREFRKVLDMEAANKLAISNLASLELNQKKWDEAQAWYEKLVAIDPNDEAAWYSMGFIAWSRWFPALAQARRSLGMKLEDPGPLPAGPVKEELKVKYGQVIEGGLRALQQGLLIDPKFADAMAYMNLLIRERADLRDNTADYQGDIAVANEWVEKAMATKREQAAQSAGQTAAFGVPPVPPVPPPPPPPPQPPAQGGGGGYRVDRIQVSGNVQAAMLIRKVTPVYPSEAKLAGIQGKVTLSVVIGADGSVIEANLADGNPTLGQAALDAVRQWLYRPTLLNGEPVAVATRVEVNFQMSQ